MDRWSSRIKERFAVSLPSDVVDWFDGEVRSNQHAIQPVEPEQILEGGAGIIWGGQHLPDTLPVLDAGNGDVWCLRFGATSNVTEVLYWQHEGGNWRPVAGSLAEAIAYEISDETAHFEDLSLLRGWAARCLGVPASALQSREALFETGWARPAILRDRCEAALNCGLLQACMEVGGASIAEAVGIEWPTFYYMRMDTARFEPALREGIASHLKTDPDPLFTQDWEGAAGCAAAFLELRPDIAWPGTVLGYASERAGDFDSAVRHYSGVLDTLGSSQDFVAEWHPPMKFWPGKFAVQRLGELRPGYDSAYVQAALESAAGVENYWFAEGERAECEGRHAEAYRCYYKSGWDDFSTNNSALLERLVRSARAAGFEALARIAEHHLASLQNLSPLGKPPKKWWQVWK